MHNSVQAAAAASGDCEAPVESLRVVRLDSSDEPVPSVRFESPSLHPGAKHGPPAYELKFLLDPALALEVERLLRPHLAVDPHADPTLDGAYAISTLYCDTPEWEVIRRIGFHQHRKFRIRRYGESTRIYVERKTKHGLRVEKRRDAIDQEVLEHFQSADLAPQSNVEWFRQQLTRRGLAPVSRVTYLRHAYFGAAETGPVRLTFDRQLRGAPIRTWSFDPPQAEQPLLGDQVICEFKFCLALPRFFKEVIVSLKLSPRGYSKYRRCMELHGLADKGRNGHA